MKSSPNSTYLLTLKDLINPHQNPFSDQGSRLLLYQHPDRDALYLKLAERLEAIQPGLETHRDRLPFLQDLVFLNSQGSPLPFSLTTYPHVLAFQTPAGPFRIAFQDHDTLAIGLPEGQASGIAFTVIDPFPRSGVDGADPINRRRLRVESTQPLNKNDLGETREGRRLEFLTEGESEVCLFLTLQRGGDPVPPPVPFSRVEGAAEDRWHRWFSQAPPVEGRLQTPYYYAWWVLGNNLVAPLGQMNYEAVMPSKAQYLGAWNWDSAFHAVALRHADPGLARGQVRVLLDKQRPDGMLPDVVHDEGVVDWMEHPLQGPVTKPPVMAWAALKIHQTAPDVEFLQEIYPRLVRWNRWWTENRASERQGLSQYDHPYSSGLDDHPLWDHGFPVISPDLNSYLVVQMESLAVIADLLHLPEEAALWREAADTAFGRMVAALYDPHKGCFQALHQGEVIPEFTLVSLFPLWTGRCSPPIEAALLSHLTDPELFWAPHPLRTVAGRSPNYSPTRMWRGPTWINTNYLFVEALQRIKQVEKAVELRERTLELVSSHPGIYEYYNPETGAPPESAAPMFGWSAALFIDLCLQGVRGRPSG